MKTPIRRFFPHQAVPVMLQPIRVQLYLKYTKLDTYLYFCHQTSLNSILMSRQKSWMKFVIFMQIGYFKMLFGLQALDRFAQFFICPLFTEEATMREIMAVISEHEKNLMTDVWRIRQCNKSLSNPEHPYSKVSENLSVIFFYAPRRYFSVWYRKQRNPVRNPEKEKHWH